MNTEKQRHPRTSLNILMALVIILFFLAIFTPFLIKGKVAEAVQKEAEKMMFAKVEFSDLRIDMIKHFPMIAFNIKNVVITGTCSDFKNDTLMSADKMELTITPSSLLKESGYEIRQIALVSPVINARVSPYGSINWNIFKSDTTHFQKEKSHPFSYTSFHLKLDKVDIKQGQISFLDLESMHGIECLNLNLKLKGPLYKNDPQISIKCQFDEINLSDDAEMQQEIHVSFNGKIRANFSQKAFVLADNILKTGDKQSSLQGAFSVEGNQLNSSIQFSKENESVKGILRLIHKMYLKNYDFNQACTSVSTRETERLAIQTIPGDSIHLYAEREADSILNRANEDIRILISKAQTPLMKIAAEKAALKIIQKAHTKADKIREEAKKQTKND